VGVAAGQQETFLPVGTKWKKGRSVGGLFFKKNHFLFHHSVNYFTN